MTQLILACVLTLLVSGICSLLEAFILSLTTAEIEGLKQENVTLGEKLECYVNDLDETSAAILTLNTIANTAGAALIGYLAARYATDYAVYVTGLMVVGILVFSEIIPKNMGVAYRKNLLKILVYPIAFVRFSMWPMAYVAKHSVRMVIEPVEVDAEEHEQEIILLAEKRAKEGALTISERDLISNALSLDEVRVADIMTPRTVVSFLEQTTTVEEVCRDLKNLLFARMPVYDDHIDQVVGLVRRRDILQASSDDRDGVMIRELMTEISFIPETATVSHALQLFLKKHQQLALVVDEFGSTAGVITMEDVVEQLLGREIYEESDLAVDMREFARNQADKQRQDEGDVLSPSKKDE